MAPTKAMRRVPPMLHNSEIKPRGVLVLVVYIPINTCISLCCSLFSSYIYASVALFLRARCIK